MALSSAKAAGLRLLGGSSRCAAEKDVMRKLEVHRSPARGLNPLRGDSLMII
ncbi:MAG: hypothetical protein IKX30_03150 [Victivallales bacterium]|nr:hypothetical protein [Victivallales bacterium]